MNVDVLRQRTDLNNLRIVKYVLYYITGDKFSI